MANRDINALTNNTKTKWLKLKEKVMSEFGYDIFITDGLRTTEDQQNLYAQGRTKSGNIVTYVDGVKYKSSHQYGVAFDIAFRGSELYPSEHSVWENVGSISRSLGLEWGYDLWNWDKPHFQNTGDKPLELVDEDSIIAFTKARKHLGIVWDNNEELRPYINDLVDKARKIGLAK